MKSDSLIEILNLSKENSHISPIDDSLVDRAKYRIIQWIVEKYSEDDLFELLLSLNLLNAAIKSKTYKKRISYGLIKSRAAQLFELLIQNEIGNKNISFFINLIEKCAYVEMRGLQFSYHQISLKNIIKDFSLSEENIVKPWRGIRLQKIAAELYVFFL
ncbi:MAG: hypothetical protein PF518_00825 [Spirochaetaceae bacterium]|jgi:hypothetical protein|nr:hypothetical protein [Spirochaetaceae bacterium]